MNTKRFFDYIERNGVRSTVNAVRQHLKDRAEDRHYNDSLEAMRLGEEELLRQKEACFEREPLLSILVPAYLPEDSHFRQMLRSVKAQTYENYELIIGNGGGISENTNAAFSEAKGEYVALLDQDDFIEPDALYQVVKAINKGARLIYTDEDKYDTATGRYLRPFRKKDFDMELLCSNNYICHFLVVEKKLIDEAGWLRREYDGAQDHDLILRCAERLKREEIAHVDRILYHWRIHERSTAGDPGTKEYAHEAGRRAIEDHLRRTGIAGEVKETEHRGFYRIEYPKALYALRYSLQLGEGIMAKEASAVETMAAILEANPDIGAVGGRVIDRMGRVVSSGYMEDGLGGYIPMYHGMDHNLSGAFHMASLRQEADAVSNQCVMLREETRSCYDSDTGRMCRKIREKGYRIVIDPRLLFIKK